MRPSIAFVLALPLALASPLDPRAPSTCPACNPHPPNNVCNPTTSCAPIGTNTYCACRAGYRATTGARPGDTSVQWRLTTPGQEGRVFVAPGATCDTLCDHWELGAQGCQEVGLRADCAWSVHIPGVEGSWGPTVEWRDDRRQEQKENLVTKC